jgi:hypothetical protein
MEMADRMKKNNEQLVQQIITNQQQMTQMIATMNSQGSSGGDNGELKREIIRGSFALAVTIVTKVSGCHIF